MSFKHLHPAVLMLYYIGLMVFIFLCKHPFLLAIPAAGVTALAFFYVGAKQTLQRLRFTLPLVLLIGLANPLLVRRGATILCYLGGNPITLEAVSYGAYQGVLVYTVISLFLSFNQVIDSSAFLYLTARHMPRTALILNMALYTLSRLQQRAADFREVQQTKGITYAGCFTARLRTAICLFVAFATRSLEEGMETAAVLKARDYGAAKRSFYQSYRFAVQDGVCMLLLAVLGLFIFWGLISGVGHFTFYPQMQTLLLTRTEVVYALLILLYVFFPLFLEKTNRRTNYAR